MKQCLIYIPGIRDDLLGIQSVLLQTMRLYGVLPLLHEMPWSGSGTYDSKLEALIKRIDSRAARGYSVSLIGASAGASAALNAYVQRREVVRAVVLICGKIQRPEGVADHTYATNPAFKTAMHQLQDTLRELTPADKVKMLSLYSPKDVTVPYQDTVIPGVKEQALPALSHGKAILYTISLGSKRIIDFTTSHQAP